LTLGLKFPPLHGRIEKHCGTDTIDMITSDHNPMDIEHKKMEFDMAKDGTIGLESAFAL
jgi:dihydroorotase-like cyclic amidohydrolase